MAATAMAMIDTRNAGCKEQVHWESTAV